MSSQLVPPPTHIDAMGDKLRVCAWQGLGVRNKTGISINQQVSIISMGPRWTRNNYECFCSKCIVGNNFFVNKISALFICLVLWNRFAIGYEQFSSKYIFYPSKIFPCFSSQKKNIFTRHYCTCTTMHINWLVRLHQLSCQNELTQISISTTAWSVISHHHTPLEHWRHAKRKEKFSRPCEFFTSKIIVCPCKKKETGKNF